MWAFLKTLFGLQVFFKQLNNTQSNKILTGYGAVPKATVK